MKPTVPRDLGVGVGVGAFSGLMGVGGGIILIPYLTGVRKYAQKNASATSLVLVFMSGIAGAITYALKGQVAWVPAIFIVIGGLIGAWIGAIFVQRLKNSTLQLAFGVLILVMAIRLVFYSNPSPMESVSDMDAITAAAIAVYFVAGLAMGVLSALFGIGGGVILVPILVAVFGYGQQFANGTSLAVMIPIALLGAIRLTKPGLTDWRTGFILGCGAIVGAIIGASIATFVHGEWLRIAFALVLLFLGVRTLRIGFRNRKSEKLLATK